MRAIFMAIFCFLFFVAPSFAGEPDEVRSLLKGKIDAVLVLLMDKSVDKASRDADIIDIITPIFDYQTMAKLSLGKKYWPSLSPDKQAAFSDLFISRLQESYLDKLDLYTDEKIIYGDPLSNGKKIQVATTLLSKDSSIDMIYKFYRSSVGWKIYDVEIGGVSVIQTYRSQFDGVLREGTIDDLMDKLKTEGTFVIPAPEQKGAQPGSA